MMRKPVSKKREDANNGPKLILQKVVEVATTITTLVILITIGMSISNYSSKLKTLEDASRKINSAVQKEVSLRKIYWADMFVYKKDSTNSYIDSILQYDVVKDTLVYKRKKLIK